MHHYARRHSPASPPATAGTPNRKLLTATQIQQNQRSQERTQEAEQFANSQAGLEFALGAMKVLGLRYNLK